jgi:GNAT superfamily N-acetyltransferase
VESRPLESAEYDAAARVITDALIDDPGWLAVGPDRRGHRRRVALRYHRTALAVMDRYGRPIYGAFPDGAGLAGVAATFGAGRYPPPAWTFLRYVPGFLLAGPAPIVRGLRTSAVQDKGHPKDEHVFLFLAVDPAHQRTGIGRKLLARVINEAERGRGPCLPRHLQPREPAVLRELRLRGDRQGGAPARRHDVVHEASLRRWASGSPSSFFSVLFSI